MSGYAAYVGAFILALVMAGRVVRSFGASLTVLFPRPDAGSAGPRTGGTSPRDGES